MPISKQEVEKLKKDEANGKLIKTLTQAVGALQDKEAISKVSKAIASLESVVSGIKLPKDNSTKVVAALNSITEKLEGIGNDSTTDLVEVMKNLLIEVTDSNSAMLKVINSRGMEEVFNTLSDELKELKYYMKENQNAEWEFDTSRNNNGQITKIKAKRIR